jgi:hypothetical protein
MDEGRYCHKEIQSILPECTIIYVPEFQWSLMYGGSYLYAIFTVINKGNTMVLKYITHRFCKSSQAHMNEWHPTFERTLLVLAQLQNSIME